MNGLTQRSVPKGALPLLQHTDVVALSKARGADRRLTHAMACRSDDVGEGMLSTFEVEEAADKEDARDRDGERQ